MSVPQASSVVGSGAMARQGVKSFAGLAAAKTINYQGSYLLAFTLSFYAK